MSFLSPLTRKLAHPTSFFGLQLWVSILIGFGLLTFFILLFLVLYLFSCRRRESINLHRGTSLKPTSSMDRRLLSRNNWDNEMGSICTPEKQVMYLDRWSAQASGRKSNFTELGSMVSGSRGGVVYMLKEIELATNGLADENVIGSGEYGVVYQGLLLDNVRVAVKKLISLSGKDDENFVAEVEAMSSFRHRNLVKLLGYCIEGTYRMLVYEYVDNGNLQRWLHGCFTNISPLTWNIRMNIIQGTAKGLAYLHEDIEPALVHQHIKSSNILLDHQWNPKISDLGIVKLLVPAGRSHSIALPTGMCGYMGPEYDQNLALDEKSDIYSFGILIMEIMSGRTAIERSGTEIESYLVDWFKSMVANQKFNQVVDPKLPEMPSLKELKRIILIALRCVDPDVENRPKMGDIIHMLEPLDLLLSDERVTKRKTSRSRSSCSKENIDPRDATK